MKSRPISSHGNDFEQIYKLLYDHFGPQNWWPAETSLEMVVGAVLTQNTNWNNVNKALDNLRVNGLLEFDRLLSVDVDLLAHLIRPSGYYNVKAKRLKNLLLMVTEQYEGSLEQLFQDSLDEARSALLNVKGVGPETADCILLYGGGQPIFVVDTYTHRIFSRHNLLAEETDYQTIQDEFMSNLAPDSTVFNEYHALIVKLGKKYCKKTKPLCENCPLDGFGVV